MAVDNTGAPNRIRALRQARGWSQEQLATACRPKTSQPQIDRLEAGKRKLTQEWMRIIGQALEVDPALLLPNHGLNMTSQRPTDGDGPSGNQPALGFLPRGHLGFAGPRDLPILGHAKAGELGFFLGNGERQGVTVRPESLRDVAFAYAARVHDESMKPALKPGHLLYVDPTRPVKPGDLVVIQLHDGQAFIKELVRRTDKAVICAQYNPAIELKYPPAKIKAVHLVVQASFVDV